MKRSHTIVTITLLALVLMVGLVGCSQDKGATTEPAPGTSEPADSQEPKDDSQKDKDEDKNKDKDKDAKEAADLPENSILLFNDNEGAAQLVANMAEGTIPVRCEVMYDQMGSRPSVTVTDEDTIKKIYELVANIEVQGESNMSVTDSYHYVYFELQDGTKVGFNFEGQGNLVSGKKNYYVKGDAQLWSYVRNLQENGAPTSGNSGYDIEVEDEYGVVVDCPAVAEAGEVVRIETVFMADAAPTISIDGNHEFGTWTAENVYEFVMPNHDVEVYASFSTYGFGGA